MSRRRAPIELEEIPTLKQAYEEKKFSPRNLKRTATHPRLYEYNEEYNKKISLIQADITKLKIDAIVNAANETLLGGGGVDGAIHRAAGPELRHECWDLNGCDTGDAKITKGYDLPSKHVIHTVGPVGEKPHLLRSAYERSMQVMCENNLKSIAFSNISTGVYGYPRVKAGHVALEAMRKWMEENLDYLEKLDRIIFCVFEDENKDVYESLFPIYFPPPADLDNYEKEEEIPKSKTIEEKKGNEAEKDKDQEKTTLTTEQVNNNKEIIGTDNDEGGKEKVEEKTQATGQVNDKDKGKQVEENDKEKTLTTGQKDEDKKVEENDKEKTLTTGQKVEDKKGEENDKEKTLTIGQKDEDKKGEEDDKEKTLTTGQKDEDKKVKEEVKEKAQTTEQVNDKNEEEVAEKTQTTEQNNEKGKDKDKEIEEEKTQKTGQDNNENKNIEEKTHQDDDINKDNGENKDKIQVTDNSAAITDQVKDKTHDTNILTDHDTDMTDAKNNDEIYDNEIYDTDIKMGEAITEQDENKTPDIKTVDATTEQNSKKRPHEDAETEQNDMNQNNIANSTMTGNTGQHEDVIMVHADDVKENSEPPTNVKENSERPINVKENVDLPTDVCKMESEPTTEPKTSKEENDRVDSPEVTEQTDNKSKNNSKI